MTCAHEKIEKRELWHIPSDIVPNKIRQLFAAGASLSTHYCPKCNLWVVTHYSRIKKTLVSRQFTTKRFEGWGTFTEYNGGEVKNVWLISNEGVTENKDFWAEMEAESERKRELERQKELTEEQNKLAEEQREQEKILNSANKIKEFFLTEGSRWLNENWSKILDEIGAPDDLTPEQLNEWGWLEVHKIYKGEQ